LPIGFGALLTSISLQAHGVDYKMESIQTEDLVLQQDEAEQTLEDMTEVTIG
jgi:hypothetical protein